MLWHDLNGLARFSALIGLIGGGLGIFPGIISIAFGPVAVLLLFVIPVVSLGCSLRLLFYPANEERRGVLSFISFSGSILPILFMSFLLLKLVLPHRDSPIGI